MTVKLAHVISFVDDIDAAVAFYRHALGLQPRSVSPGWVEFDTGTTTLALHSADARNPNGSTKFSFDLWGDTVNVAQRLSAYGVEPAIYLSASAWAPIADRARGQALGPVSIKGKGDIEIIRCEPKRP